MVMEMTKDEIKAGVSMKDVLARYGLLANRAGFIRCPFHRGDREASMKVYDRDFHCFGCGENGDVFSFVMKMENCSFSDAFQLLGGTYEHKANDFSKRLAIYKQRKAVEKRRRAAEKEAKERRLNVLLITVYRRYMKQSEPFTDAWCDCCNALQMQLIRLEEWKEGQN